MGNKFECQCQQDKEQTYLIKNFEEFTDHQNRIDNRISSEENRGKTHQILKNSEVMRSDCNYDSEEVFDENSIQKPKIYHETKAVINSVQKFKEKTVETTPSIGNEEINEETRNIRNDSIFCKKFSRGSKYDVQGIDKQSRNVYRDISESSTYTFCSENIFRQRDQKIRTFAFNHNKLNIPNFSEYQFSRNKINAVFTSFDKLQKTQQQNSNHNEFIFLRDKMYKLQCDQKFAFNFISISCFLTKDAFTFKYLRDEENYNTNKEPDVNNSKYFSIQLKDIERVRVVKILQKDQFLMEKPLYFFEIVINNSANNF